MSYSIIYGTQFIKAQKGSETVYLPIMLIGDNNVYDWSNNGKQRRARSFTNLTNYTGGKQFATEQEILANVDNARTRIIESNEKNVAENYSNEYTDDSFGWFANTRIGSQYGSFKQFKNLFINGFKNAITIEQLAEINIQLNVYTSHYSVDKLTENDLLPVQITPKTTADLLEAISNTEYYLKDTNITFYVDFRGDDDTLKYIKKKYNPSTPKAKAQPKLVNSYFVIKLGNGYEFYQLTARKLRFSTNGKRFTSKAVAQKTADKIEARYTVKVTDIKEVTVNEPIYI